jgi:uncharacterized protein (TIGR04255 family)
MLAHLQSVDGIARLQDRLGDRFPYLNQRSQQQLALQFQIGPGGLAAGPGITSAGWEFTDDNGNLLLVEPGALTLSVGSAYEGFDSFQESLGEVLVAFTETEPVRRCERIGVRYLSLAELTPGEQREWTQWFRPELLGWAGHPDVLSPATQLVSTLTQVQLVGAPDASLGPVSVSPQAIIRHGWLPAGSLLPGVPPLQPQEAGYFMDLDIAVATPQRFDVATIVNQFQWLHHQIDRFFAWSLTENGRAHFEFEER